MTDRLHRLRSLIKPGMKYALLVDDPESDPVNVLIGIRGMGTLEIEIEKARYDPIALLEVIERHGAAA